MKRIQTGATVRVQVFVKNSAIFVKINDSMHLRVLTKDLVMIHSWHYDKNFFIEFIFNSPVHVLVEHDNKDIWLAILAGIERVEW